MLGGYGKIKQADGESQNMIDKLKKDINHLVKKNHQKFTVINYKTQIVNGTNYKVKVVTEDKCYYHVTVHKDLDQESRLMGCLNNQKKESEL